MPRAPSSFARIVLSTVTITAAAVTVSAMGCSVFSGWSDLQGGTPERKPDAAKTDGGSTDASVGRDSSTPTGTPPEVLCGNDICALGRGCCFLPGTPGEGCTLPEACSGGTFFGCADRGACVDFLGPGATCCLDTRSRQAQCTLGSCRAGQTELCDDAQQAPCSRGDCIGDLGINDAKACR